MNTGSDKSMLRERRFAELSSLTHEMFTVEFDYQEGRARLTATALIMAFHGDYRPGSRGNPDARFMEAMVCAGTSAWEPRVLVLDLRGLSYFGGDMIGRAWEMEPRLPTAIVVSDTCRVAMTSYVAQEMGEDPAAWLFPSAQEALDAAIERFKRERTEHGVR